MFSYFLKAKVLLEHIDFLINFRVSVKFTDGSV